jgi:hypothetical protein
LIVVKIGVVVGVDDNDSSTDSETNVFDKDVPELG